MFTRCTVLAAAFLACVGTQASATNLLNNPGFESDLGFDFSNPSNWNGFFGGPPGTFLEAFNTTGAAPHGGDKALVTTIRGVPGITNGLNSFTGHVQIVSGITPGMPYELSVWARANPLILDGAEFRVEWKDAGGAEVGRFNSVITGGLTSTYQLFSFTDIAPPLATQAAIVLAVQSFHEPGYSLPADTSVAWDDASFGIIPTPGAAMLFGAAGVLGFRRRRG